MSRFTDGRNRFEEVIRKMGGFMDAGSLGEEFAEDFK